MDYETTCESSWEVDLIMGFLKEIRISFEKNWNEKKYWKRRQYVQCKKKGLLRAIRIMLLRRIEAKKCSTTGLSFVGRCCIIESPLILYHGLCGIVIAPNTHIGKNVTIYQHVTIAKEDPNKTTIIEDDVVIGAGAVILKNAHIGKGATIGANAVVLCDVPDHSTAVGVPARIIKKGKI